MFDSAPGVHDQDFQLYISMLEGLIVNTWSTVKHLQTEVFCNFSTQAEYLLVNVNIQLDSGWRKTPWEESGISNAFTVFS